MLFYYCELIGIGLKIFGVDRCLLLLLILRQIYIEIDVEFVMLMRLIVHTITKLRIPKLRVLNGKKPNFERTF